MDKELTVKNLIKLREHYYNTFILIMTGVLGLFFVNINNIKLIILLIIGLFFAFIFISKFIETDKKIDSVIGKDN